MSLDKLGCVNCVHISVCKMKEKVDDLEYFFDIELDNCPHKVQRFKVCNTSCNECNADCPYDKQYSKSSFEKKESLLDRMTKLVQQCVEDGGYPKRIGISPKVAKELLGTMSVLVEEGVSAHINIKGFTLQIDLQPDLDKDFIIYV